MQATAAVINAGLGDISLALQAAGFSVLAAYEGDEKALAVHKANIDVSVYPLAPQEIEPKLLPEVDLLAARIYQASFSRTTHTTSDPSIYKLLEILSIRRPRAFFLILNAFSSKNEQFQAFMAEILKLGYQYTLRVIDVTQATGLPVKERTVCMVGTLQSEDKLFEFPEYNSPIQILPEQCLQLNQPVDPWYFHVKSDKISQHERWAPFYCWKNNTYVEADRVQWNYIKIPLVKAGNAFRKITHREIATLKGFPVNYTLFDDMSKQWLYQKLMYAGNVLVIKQIAGTLNYILADNPFRSQQAERGMHLEILFRRYLSSLVDGGTIERSLSRKARVVDFAVRLEETNLYFEVKYYNSTISLPSKVRAVCKQLSSLASDGMPILVVANEVADSVKSECWKQFHVSIWDVGNLLWLFDELSDIRNDFVAWLDYSTEHVEIKPPFPNVFQKTPENRKEEPGWYEKLQHIKPGREQSQAYEAVCIEILKYVLGDYLTLWEAQKSANAGLYRFDLCCKIKIGANQDFFDTIKQYFNTKYIVFEFKNYSEKISQKEIYTTEKYLYEKALRKVAIIISRTGADDHALQAAKGSLRENGKLILCLSDNSLLEMIDIKERGEQEPAEFLGALLDDFLVHLEK